MHFGGRQPDCPDLVEPDGLHRPLTELTKIQEKGKGNKEEGEGREEGRGTEMERKILRTPLAAGGQWSAGCFA